MKSFDDLVAKAARQDPNTIPTARDLIVASLPKVIYYSNYGNLDSEIYLHGVSHGALTNAPNAAMKTSGRLLIIGLAGPP
jgi:hypothetical protein